MKILQSRDTMSDIYLDALRIRQDVFVKEQGVPEELEVDEYDPICVNFVLYDEEDKAIATARLLENKQENSAKVQRVAVRKEARGKDYGKHVMEACERFAKEERLSALKLHAQLSALPFYEKLGYKVYGEEFMDAGIPHIRMKKEILGVREK